jgi:tetratricopeptide (TPR) repeat protein
MMLLSLFIRRTAPLAVSALLLCTGNAPAQTAPATVPDQTASTPGSDAAIPPSSITEARRLVEGGRSEEALRELSKLAVQTPEPPDVEKLRGLALYQQNKLPEAETAFARAASQDPKDVEATQMQGVTLFRMGKPAEAVPLLERAHGAVASANVDGNYVLGLCYMDTRRYDDARRSFAAQYGFPPESAESYLLAARLLFRREYTPIAISAAQKALALNPKMPLVHELLGEIALAESRGSDAISEFEQERALNPLYGGVYDRLGDAYVRAGEYEKAQQALNRAVLLEPTSTGPYILLGKVLLKQRNAAMATMYLERARNMDPNNFMTHSLLGQAYRAVGRTQDAERETAKAIEIQAANTPKLSKP